MDTSLIAPPLQEEMLRMSARITKLERALKPFAACVFNDNFDMTVTMRVDHDDYIRAWHALRD